MNILKIVKNFTSVMIIATLFFSCISKSEKTDKDVNDTIKNEVMTSSKNNGLPTVIDFYATWCVPCKQIEPLYHELEKQYEGKIQFESVDVDEQKEVAQEYKVNAMPTFVFLDANGKEVDRMVGAIPEDLKSKLKKLAETGN